MDNGVMSSSHGDAAERRASRVAAMLGVPEFVYGQPVVPTGSGIREVGDGILLCGFGGAILQVKARGRREGLADSDDAACRWIRKHSAKAVRQGRGSKRTITSFQTRGNPLTAVPVRSMVLSGDQRKQFHVRLDEDCSDWPVIVVIAHPRTPELILPFHDDVFYVTMEDWHLLNHHLRSVHEVLRYVRLVLENGSTLEVPLGREGLRFRALASMYLNDDRPHRSSVAPISFAAVHAPSAVAAYRDLIDKTAAENDDSTGFVATDYREILDYLDDVPAAVQANVGQRLMRWHDELQSTRSMVSGSALLKDRLLVYMADFDSNQPDKKKWLATLGMLTALRQIEWSERVSKSGAVLGVGVRFSDGDLVEYSYILVRGGSKISTQDRRRLEWAFGVSNFSTFHARRPRVARNELCPCGSSLKYKRCHGRR
ncbi:SEC-C domain-containing protein [Dactylosporangium sp. NPDC000244]|uniref:YecA family protein n=1 Tax=Dactylosporangium sp. NPDC000244 TaxID=3154365 RepID=UPI00332D730A